MKVKEKTCTILGAGTESRDFSAQVRSLQQVAVRGRRGTWREQDACQKQVCCSPPVPGHRPAAQCVRLDVPQPPPRFLPWKCKVVGTKAAPARGRKPGFQKPAACVSHSICWSWAEKEERYLITVFRRHVFIPVNPRDSWLRRV